MFNEVILSAIFDSAKSTAAGIIFSETCCPANLPIFKPSFFNALPYLLSLNFFAAVFNLLDAEIPLFAIF